MLNVVAIMFSPPYGDSTDITANNILFCKFSPPYGDSTDDIKYREAREKFSPPYGDGTVFQNIQALSGSVSVPLRG